MSRIGDTTIHIDRRNDGRLTVTLKLIGWTDEEWWNFGEEVLRNDKTFLLRGGDTRDRLLRALASPVPMRGNSNGTENTDG